MGDNNIKDIPAAASVRSSKFKVTAEPALFLLYLGTTIQVSDGFKLELINM